MGEIAGTVDGVEAGASVVLSVVVFAVVSVALSLSVVLAKTTCCEGTDKRRCCAARPNAEAPVDSAANEHRMQYVTKRVIFIDAQDRMTHPQPRFDGARCPR